MNPEAIEQILDVVADAAVDNLGAAAGLAGGTVVDFAKFAEDPGSTVQSEGSDFEVWLELGMVAAGIGPAAMEIDRMSAGSDDRSIAYGSARIRSDFDAAAAAGSRLQVDFSYVAFAVHSAVVGTDGVEGHNYYLAAGIGYPRRKAY